MRFARFAGYLLIPLGLFIGAGGLFVGCGSALAWNGLRSIAMAHAKMGEPATAEIDTVAGRTYTAGIAMRVDRRELDAQNGTLIVDARWPSKLVFVEDAKEVARDEREIANGIEGVVLSGDSVRSRGDVTVYKFLPAHRADASGHVSLTAMVEQDADGYTSSSTYDAVIYDDAMPSAMKTPFMVAVGGVLSIILGVLALAFSGGKKRAIRDREPA